MPEPRLTIGIPTYNRPELLKRAIESALDQTVPARIVIADQGHSAETNHVVSQFLRGEHAHLIRHVLTDATNIWENWCAAADAADTEFFAWLQDDDIVSRNYASRIITAFDAFPQADTWIARLALATGPDRALWFLHNGPMVPFDLLKGLPCLVEGRLFPPLVYFSSFGLSPGAAFRVGDTFREARNRCPSGCDLFTERMILAAMGLKGPIVCDPVIAGYWVQHEENESKRQHAKQDEQVKAMARWADEAMRECDDWKTYLESWANIMPTPHLMGFISELSSPLFAESEFAWQVRDVLTAALMKDAQLVEAPPDTLKAIGFDVAASLKAFIGRLASLISRVFAWA